MHIRIPQEKNARLTGRAGTHYFWEFLMLFLAVFCGFLAEYQLEHKIEKDREKKYIQSMVDDLKRDTANFRFLIYKWNQNMTTIDSLITLLQSADRDSHTSVLYYLARKIPYTSFPVEIFDRTYTQMKSSGNLRLLHSKAVADSITSYYFDVSLLESQQHFVTSFLLDYMKSVSVVFDAAVFHKMFKEAGLTLNSLLGARSYELPNIPPPEGNPPLSDTSKNAVNILIGNSHFLYGRVLSIRNFIWRKNEKTIILIQLLKKQYHIK
jgi:hypothetical protein